MFYEMLMLMLKREFSILANAKISQDWKPQILSERKHLKRMYLHTQ